MSHGSSRAAQDDVTIGDAEIEHDEAHEVANRQSIAAPGPSELRDISLSKRQEFLFHLLVTLDAFLFAQLSAIYYMDCFFVGFILRAVSQLTCLSPKPVSLRVPKNAPYIGAIIGSNIVCAFLHLYRRGAQAEEASRGYLHGGIIIDFIGQKGPSSKIHLVLLDLLVLVGQIFMLAVAREHQKVKTAKMVTSPTPSRRMANSRRVGIGVEAQSLLTQDSTEDTGSQMHRHGRSYSSEVSIPAASDQNDGNPEATTGVDRAADSEIEGLPEIMESYFSGQVILADFRMLDSVQDEFWKYRNGHRSTMV